MHAAPALSVLHVYICSMEKTGLTDKTVKDNKRI